MDLGEFVNQGGYSKFQGSEEEYFSLAQEAAKRFLAENILNLSSVYLSNRFGEFILDIYIPDDMYKIHEKALPGVPKKYNGFKVITNSERNRLPSLEDYKGVYFFAK